MALCTSPSTEVRMAQPSAVRNAPAITSTVTHRIASRLRAWANNIHPTRQVVGRVTTLNDPMRSPALHRASAALSAGATGMLANPTAKSVQQAERARFWAQFSETWSQVRRAEQCICEVCMCWLTGTRFVQE